jgi:hypothetical protein
MKKYKNMTTDSSLNMMFRGGYGISNEVAVTIKGQYGIFADANAFHLAYFQSDSQCVLKGMLDYPTVVHFYQFGHVGYLF